MRYSSRSRARAVFLGTSDLANAGRQHSSRMVSWTRSTQPLLLGRPARMKRCLPPRRWTVAPKSLARNSEPLSVVTSPSFQPAAASSAATRCNSSRVWRKRGLRSELCSWRPAERRGDVDGRVLPDRALGPAQAADVEAVELDLLARLGRVDVTLGRRQIGLALVRIAMPSDQRQALGAGVQAHAAQHAPHPVLADPDATPLLAGQLGT